MSRPRPVHLLVRRDGAPAPVLACGKTVTGGGMLGKHLTHDPAEASCFGCAKEAPELTRVQRQIIWDRRNEVCAKPRNSPWEIEDRRNEREAKKAARAAARAERLAKSKSKAA